MPTLAEISDLVSGQIDGNGSIEISHCCDINLGDEGGITFIATADTEYSLKDHGASAAIIDLKTPSEGMPVIRVDNPSKAFAQTLAYLHPPAEPERRVHPAAVVEDGASIGMNVSIAPFAHIGRGATIGDGAIIGSGTIVGANAVIGRGTHLYPRVVIYDRMQIGSDVIIHSGTVIGTDGFGYVSENDVHTKVPQIGRVIIGDRVEIGGNCAIDRGTLTDTIIGQDTKFDNLVHIAHNVRIGRGCLIAGEVGIAGSTVIGDFVTMGGQVGIISHVSVGDRTVIASKAAVFKPVGPGEFFGGIPAEDQRQWIKKQVALKGFSDLVRRVKYLEGQFRSSMESNEQQGRD